MRKLQALPVEHNSFEDVQEHCTLSLLSTSIRFPLTRCDSSCYSVCAINRVSSSSSSIIVVSLFVFVVNVFVDPSVT